ncbi:MAG: ATP-binding protein [Mesorhizobium sp.]|nr:MAG: ATP-binding protein [Mesorhizobium sp.]
MPDKNSRDYRVIFAREPGSGQEPGVIVISPSSDRWNDFGFRIRVDIAIYPLDSRTAYNPLVLQGFLGFQSSEVGQPDTRLIDQILDGGTEQFVESAKLPNFFTMLPDMSGYRTIVGELGAGDAQKALRAMRDMVQAEVGMGGGIWARHAKATTVFQVGFLRSTEAYFAWKNASTILEGLEFEVLGRISEELVVNFQLAGRPNRHELAFKFDQGETTLPKRFAVVIGANGVGKSQALARIANAAQRGSEDLQDQDGQRPAFNRLLAFAPTASTSVFPPRRRGSRVWYRRFALSGRDNHRDRQATSDLIVQLSRAEERIKDNSRFRLFLNAVSNIECFEELRLPGRKGDWEGVSIAELRRGSEQEVLDRMAELDIDEEPVRFVKGKHYRLSSGEQSFVRFAALTSLYIENGTLLLFDEPETHLHPSLISQFVAVLDSLLEETGSVAIIATHSVYFVREAFEDQVRVLRSQPDRSIVVDIPTLKTFGADVGAISYFVFGEDQPSRLAHDVELRIAESSNDWEEVFARYKDDLSLELLSEIRARLSRRGTRAAGK